jgi:hypothetical protein
VTAVFPQHQSPASDDAALCFGFMLLQDIFGQNAPIN